MLAAGSGARGLTNGACSGWRCRPVHELPGYRAVCVHPVAGVAKAVLTRCPSLAVSQTLSRHEWAGDDGDAGSQLSPSELALRLQERELQVRADEARAQHRRAKTDLRLAKLQLKLERERNRGIELRLQLADREQPYRGAHAPVASPPPAAPRLQRLVVRRRQQVHKDRDGTDAGQGQEQQRGDGAAQLLFHSPAVGVDAVPQGYPDAGGSADDPVDGGTPVYHSAAV